MNKLLRFFSVRPKLRKFLSSFYRNNLAFDLEFQLRMRAAQTTCDYIEKNMVGIPLYESKMDVIDHALKEVEISGVFCEFGVFEGESVNYIASKIDKEIHAFDSFEGLPETWLSTHKKGHFNVKKMPRFEKNVQVHKGWFNETIPEWNLEGKEQIAFLHIDCDLYSSTKTILSELDSRIVAGTLILFDEYFNYPFWEHHEFKAFKEFVVKNNVKYEYLCYNTYSFGSKVAIKIIERS